MDGEAELTRLSVRLRDGMRTLVASRMHLLWRHGRLGAAMPARGRESSLLGFWIRQCLLALRIVNTCGLASVSLVCMCDNATATPSECLVLGHSSPGGRQSGYAMLPLFGSGCNPLTRERGSGLIRSLLE